MGSFGSEWNAGLTVESNLQIFYLCSYSVTLGAGMRDWKKVRVCVCVRDEEMGKKKKA